MTPVPGHPLPEPLVAPRVGVVEPAGDDARRAARPAPQAPSCAAPSIPRARPDTTLTPAAARSAPELRRHADAVAGRRPRPHQRHGRRLAGAPTGPPGRRGPPEPGGRRRGEAGYDGLTRQQHPDAVLGRAGARGAPRRGPMLPRAGPAAPRPPRAGPPASRSRRRGGAHGGHGRQRGGVGLLREAAPGGSRHHHRAAGAQRQRLRGVGERHRRPRRPGRPRCGRPASTLCRPAGAQVARRAASTARSSVGVGSHLVSRRPGRARPPRGPAATTRAATAAEARPACPARSSSGSGPAERHDQVEAVQERRRDPAPVAGSGGGLHVQAPSKTPSPQGRGSWRPRGGRPPGRSRSLRHG